MSINEELHLHKKTAKEDISPSNKERKPTLDNIIFASDFL